MSPEAAIVEKLVEEPTAAAPPDVSFVLPCLNEKLSLPACLEVIAQARAALAAELGFASEIVVADNGSDDGSQAMAEAMGARVVSVAEKGYGAALRGGFDAAKGRFLVMGDADGSYDFREATPMVAALAAGADLCMGSRFKGAIKKGAMPWKNRYIGNPLLTGVLNLIFRARVSDAHCGLRALTADCYRRLGLTGSGMEFASEMVIKAALLKERIVERPATLSPDLRDRPPHLRPWRDGWRHLRYLFMLSPTWLFAAPALAIGAAGLAILAIACWKLVFAPAEPVFFGNYWVVLASAMVAAAHNAAILALASHLYGVRAGYRRPKTWTAPLASWISLETMIGAGLILLAAGLAVLIAVALTWRARHFGPAASVLPAVIGTLGMLLGGQTILGGFLLAIVSGNEARFLAR
ncbi:MAG TPA: glycosyltransferase family 2 protein [Caulobacteraceae bacterium]|nr:glycosyltransferase family 2 protein [Caulobacteraceae bacterium]